MFRRKIDENVLESIVKELKNIVPKKSEDHPQTGSTTSEQARKLLFAATKRRK